MQIKSYGPGGVQGVTWGYNLTPPPADLPNITTLTVDLTTPEGLESLIKKLKTLPKLKELSVMAGNELDRVLHDEANLNRLLTALQQNTKLEHLDLSHTILGSGRNQDTGIATALANFFKHKPLNELTLHKTGIQYPGLVILAQAASASPSSTINGLPFTGEQVLALRATQNWVATQLPSMEATLWRQFCDLPIPKSAEDYERIAQQSHLLADSLEEHLATLKRKAQGEGKHLCTAQRTFNQKAVEAVEQARNVAAQARLVGLNIVKANAAKVPMAVPIAVMATAMTASEASGGVLDTLRQKQLTMQQKLMELQQGQMELQQEQLALQALTGAGGGGAGAGGGAMEGEEQRSDTEIDQAAVKRFKSTYYDICCAANQKARLFEKKAHSVLSSPTLTMKELAIHLAREKGGWTTNRRWQAAKKCFNLDPEHFAQGLAAQKAIIAAIRTAQKAFEPEDDAPADQHAGGGAIGKRR
jgi:hypothetical protein